MTNNAISDILDAALVLTRSEEMVWRPAQRSSRFLADFGEWRLRIESANPQGGPPFKFSIMQPGSGLGEIAALRSVSDPQAGADAELNNRVEALWDLVGGARPDRQKSKAEQRAESLSKLQEAIGSQTNR